MTKKHDDGGPARALPDTLIKQLNEADDARTDAAQKEASAKTASEAAQAARADADAKTDTAVKAILGHFGKA